MLALDFVKMHGTQNSFVILNDLGGLFYSNQFESISIPDLPTNIPLEKKSLDRVQPSSAFKQIEGTFSSELAKKICSQSGGIGADGLVILLRSDRADFKMSILNRDGNEAEMCGNAIRCLAKYVLDQELTTRKKLSFETSLRIIETEVIENRRFCALVTVDMGAPVFSGLDFPDLNDKGYERDGRTYFCVSMGNPHAVTLVDDFDFDYWRSAEVVQSDPSFPNGINVEFVKVEDQGELSVRVVERGVGETLSCGTGACASVVGVMNHLGFKKSKSSKTDGSFRVNLLGGSLEIEYSPQNDKNIKMTGTAEKVGEGTYFYQF